MSFYVPAALLVVGALLVLLRLFNRGGIKHIRGPPSPSFILGHEAAIAHQEEAGTLDTQWMKEYGPTWRVRGAFGTDVIMSADPKAIQHVFQKSGYNYPKKESQNFLGWLLAGPGIAAVRGQDHQRQRKIMNPAFSVPQLRSFLPLFQRIATKLSNKWKGELVATGELSLLLNKWLLRATLDVIGEAAFDYNYHSLDDGERSEISKAYENIFADMSYMPPKAAVLFQASWDYIPVPILKLIRYLPLNPWTRMRKLNNLFREYGKQILREQGPDVDTEKKVNSKDVMSILIKANHSADAKTRLDDEELSAEMFTLTLAGHETTSATLTFLLYELARHPEYQERMRQEIRDVRAKVAQRGGAEFATEDLDSLTLTNNAIKANCLMICLQETLRFHPIALGLARVALKDDVIPLAYPIVSTTGETIREIPVKAGQVFSASFIGYQRLTEVWGEDANEWNPDRFFRIDAVKQPANVGVFANLLTFSAGIRACIGWRFSVLEMQAFLSELVENFQFDLPKEKVDIQQAVAGIGMFPAIRGKADQGSAMPLRISLAQ
ncbi:cytochrome P450 [Dichomitus squalens]|uniref:Cytochrome P450 n=1 Tax=Dichomitus squalens TaxID=114155 RepID=A0A4V2K0T9_9APHY|nr:cytochrome P450 [Dichomitus squalens]